MTTEDSWKPNLFVPGFSKCGTSSMCDYLRQHPDIYMFEPKEPKSLMYGKTIRWCGVINKIVRNDPISPALDYHSYMVKFRQNKRSRYRAEGSQVYSMDPEFPSILKEFNPKAKVILMIRNQQQRLRSAYFYTLWLHSEYHVGRWIERWFRPDLDTFLYYDKILKYYDAFGRNMLVFESAYLSKEPQNALNEVCDFLGLRRINVKISWSNETKFKSESKTIRRAFVNTMSVAKAANTVGRQILEKFGVRGERAKQTLLSYSPSALTTKLFSRLGETGDRPPDFFDCIPEELLGQLNEDYVRTVNFCRARGVLLNKSPRIVASDH